MVDINIRFVYGCFVCVCKGGGGWIEETEL